MKIKFSMDQLIALAKQRGFIYPGSEIYGGLANSWDYGPLGALLKNNVKKEWFRRFVQTRRDMVLIDAALIMNPRVWEASGHVSHFSDPLVEDKVTHERFRLDSLLEENGINVKGKSFEEMVTLVNAHALKSPQGNPLTEPRVFNLMLKTFLGAAEDAVATAYLRPETAQAMFIDFKAVLGSSRKKIPFGIAQIGKAFRNEITPGNFIFRTREFEQMEIEYFIHPSDWEQKFEYWLDAMKRWIREDLSLPSEMVHYHEIPEGERAHYSKRTVDIEFEFPFGQKELYGIAYRGDYDLANHIKFSGEDLSYFDQATGEKYIPHVIEPTFGVDRTILALLSAHMDIEPVPGGEGEDSTRIVFRIPPRLAPYQVALLPLAKKTELQLIASEIENLIAGEWSVEYDETQSIGKRYRRQDEIGTPFCITIDFKSIEDKMVTIRERDSMQQERVTIHQIPDWLRSHLI